jgi:ribosomal-protein-alanine N-acetyltransferase
MKIFAETERLILREILPSDFVGMFELDSDKEVHRFLGNKPLDNIEQSKQMIELIREQYVTNGIGRWAIIEKSTNNFLGWTGLKLMKELVNNHRDYYDIGYRLIKKYWGRGFATESAKASIDYGFEVLKLNEIFGSTDRNNIASRNVLEKVGVKYIETFDYEGRQTDWLKITNPL